MPKPTSSRLARFEEKRLRTKLIFAVLGSLGLVTFLVVFGFRLFIGFFVFLDQMRGKEQTQAQKSTLVIPPYLDPLPLATMSGKLKVSGRGQANEKLVLYINNEETKEVSINEDGTFEITSLNLPEGTHTLQAKIKDVSGKTSEFSNSVVTTIKKKPPKLDVTVPNDNSTINGEDNLLKVQGKTEPDNDVRINDRFVVVQPDGSFSYPFPLSEGDNELKIKAIDRAGNSTEVSRKVSYQK